jgi:hypothetical protein
VSVAQCAEGVGRGRLAKKGQSSLLLLYFFFFGVTAFFNALMEGFLLEPAGRPIFDETKPW